MPKGHNAFSSTNLVLGLVLNKTGRSAEAEPRLREAVQIRERIFTKGHYFTAITQGAVGECLTTQKRYAEAEPILKESHATMKSVQGERSPLTVEAAQRLVALYSAWNKPEEAARYQPALVQSPAPAASRNNP